MGRITLPINHDPRFSHGSSSMPAKSSPVSIDQSAEKIIQHMSKSEGILSWVCMEVLESLLFCSGFNNVHDAQSYACVRLLWWYTWGYVGVVNTQQGVELGMYRLQRPQKVYVTWTYDYMCRYSGCNRLWRPRGYFRHVCGLLSYDVWAANAERERE